MVVSNLDAFALRYQANLATILVAGEFTNNLSNDGETVVLTAADGGLISSITYNDKEPWPNQAGFAALLAIAEPGDEVLLPTPWYFNHAMAVTAIGAVPVPVATRADEGFASALGSASSSRNTTSAMTNTSPASKSEPTRTDR